MDLAADRLQRRVHLGEALIEPNRKIEAGVLDEEMDILMHRHGIELAGDALHDDVVPILAGNIKGVGGIAAAIRLIFRLRLEGDNAHRKGWRVLGFSQFVEKGAHLLEVEDRLASFLLAGVCIKFEVSRSDSEPWICGTRRACQKE